MIAYGRWPDDKLSSFDDQGRVVFKRGTAWEGLTFASFLRLASTLDLGSADVLRTHWAVAFVYTYVVVVVIVLLQVVVAVLLGKYKVWGLFRLSL